MLFNIPAKGLEIIKKSQAIKCTDDRKTEIPANYSEELPVLELARLVGKLDSFTPNVFYTAKHKIAYFGIKHTGIFWKTGSL